LANSWPAFLRRFSIAAWSRVLDMTKLYQDNRYVSPYYASLNKRKILKNKQSILLQQRFGSRFGLT